MKTKATKRVHMHCLWICFSSNWAQCTINNIYERGRFQIFLCSVADKEATTNTIHAELLFQSSLSTKQQKPTINYNQEILLDRLYNRIANLVHFSIKNYNRQSDDACSWIIFMATSVLSNLRLEKWEYVHLTRFFFSSNIISRVIFPN